MSPRTANPVKHEARKESILDAGLPVMWNKGYNGCGVKDLVEAAGIPKGSFYFYFESKEDFAVQALRRYLGMDEGKAPAILVDKSHTPLERLRLFMHQRIIAATANQTYQDGCLFVNLMTEMAGQNDAIREAILDGDAHLRRPLIACIREAIDQGEIQADEDPEALAEFIENTMRGAVSKAKASRNARPMELMMHYIFDRLLA